jgi:hypothetical protein
MIATYGPVFQGELFMHRQITSLAFVTMSLLASTALAQTLSPDEKAFFDKHVSDFITITPKRLSDAAITKTFSTPIYEVTVTTKDGDGGTGTEKFVVGRIGEKLVPLSRPGTDGDYPAIQKMINSDFKLLTDDDATALQTALNVVYPLITNDEKKVVAFRHSGHDWTFVRGTFFDKQMGFVITTDDKGTVTGVKYVLKLP